MLPQSSQHLISDFRHLNSTFPPLRACITSEHRRREVTDPSRRDRRRTRSGRVAFGVYRKARLDHDGMTDRPTGRANGGRRILAQLGPDGRSFTEMQAIQKKHAQHSTIARLCSRSVGYVSSAELRCSTTNVKSSTQPFRTSVPSVVSDATDRQRVDACPAGHAFIYLRSAGATDGRSTHPPYARVRISAASTHDRWIHLSTERVRRSMIDHRSDELISLRPSAIDTFVSSLRRLLAGIDLSTGYVLDGCVHRQRARQSLSRSIRRMKHRSTSIIDSLIPCVRALLRPSVGRVFGRYRHSMSIDGCACPPVPNIPMQASTS